MKRIFVAIPSALLVALCTPGTALAQGAGYVEKDTAAGQSVSFIDDPLGAVVGEPIGAQLSGFHPARRCDLMRPRASFVPELLKAIEKM